jgi:branched-chain amino acid transport system ATP-binding protein
VILEAKNINKNFGGLKAIDNLSFKVEQNEIFGVIGPNGAGKTTLFNLISGVERLSGGELFFEGKAVHNLKDYEIGRLGIGRTFQIVRPFSNLEVIKNVLVAYGSRFYQNWFDLLKPFSAFQYLEQARTLLDEVGLIKYANELAKNLPLGLQRRLEIARVLALNPKLLLLDESFSGLSFDEILSFLNLVGKIREQGKVIMIIEHNIDIIKQLCDRVMVLNYGEKIAEGGPQEISANPIVIEAYLGDTGKDA